MGGEEDPLGILQEIKVWLCEQMVYTQPSVRPAKWEAQTPLGFRHTNWSPNLDQTTRPYNHQQKKKRKKKRELADFTVPADHSLKLKENEKISIWTFGPSLRIEKTVEHESDDYTKCNWCSWCYTKWLVQRLEHLEIRGRVETNKNYSIIKVS